MIWSKHHIIWWLRKVKMNSDSQINREAYKNALFWSGQIWKSWNENINLACKQALFSWACFPFALRKITPAMNVDLILIDLKRTERIVRSTDADKRMKQSNLEATSWSHHFRKYHNYLFLGRFQVPRETENNGYVNFVGGGGGGGGGEAKRLLWYCLKWRIQS